MFIVNKKLYMNIFNIIYKFMTSLYAILFLTKMHTPPPLSTSLSVIIEQLSSHQTFAAFGKKRTPHGPTDIDGS